jgi:uncharacterized protein (DUF488 family)
LTEFAIPHARTPARVWTIGHSTRALEDFIAVLEQFRIEAVVDVRRFPGSRKYPHYGRDALAAALRTRAIDYRWLSELGGRRHTSPGSPNTAWRNAAFRGYADHMGSGDFARGFGQLLDTANASRAVIMCAEVLWWRCHRALIADALCVRGVTVMHILDAEHETLHPMTSAARIVGGELSYAEYGGQSSAGDDVKA